MEKTWDDFWTTGKVEDYLSYRNSVTDSITDRVERNNGYEKYDKNKNKKNNPNYQIKNEQKDQDIHGRVSSAYRDGA